MPATEEIQGRFPVQSAGGYLPPDSASWWTSCCAFVTWLHQRNTWWQEPRCLFNNLCPVPSVPLTCFVVVESVVQKSDAVVRFSRSLGSKKRSMTLLERWDPNKLPVAVQDVCGDRENLTCYHSPMGADQNTNFMPYNVAGRCFINHCFPVLEFNETASIWRH